MTPVRDAISREAVADLPIRRYEGEVIVVTTPTERERAVEDLLAEAVVGFDTETRPAFVKGQVYLPCLVQAASARAVYLFRLERGDFSPEIGALLRSRDTVKAGVAIAEDLRQLQGVFSFEAHAVVDLGKVARRHGYPQTGLRNLAALFMGVRIPKGKRTSNWAAQHLNAAQVTYAATDAWACRELYLSLQRKGLFGEPSAP